jgi:hypothetical protein
MRLGLDIVAQVQVFPEFLLVCPLTHHSVFPSCLSVTAALDVWLPDQQNIIPTSVFNPALNCSQSKEIIYKFWFVIGSVFYVIYKVIYADLLYKNLSFVYNRVYN